jgi:Flp pilus assembly protein TadG
VTFADKTIRTLWRDKRGTSVIELAITIPVIAFLLLGFVDIAMGFSAKLTLKQAANRAVEMATMRGAINGNFSYLQSEAATASGQPTSNVTVDYWLECDTVRQGQVDGECTGTEQVARYVSVVVTGAFQPIFDYGPLAQLYGGHSMGDSVAISGQAFERVQ